MNRAAPVLLPARRRQVKECAWSRLGRAMGKQVRHALIRRVRKGDVKYARKLTNSRTVIVLDHNGEELAFLYSSAAKEIISFLSPDSPETAEWRCWQAASVEILHPGRTRPDGVRR